MDFIVSGNFNVAEHIQAEESKALKDTTINVLMRLALMMILGHAVLL